MAFWERHVWNAIIITRILFTGGDGFYNDSQEQLPLLELDVNAFSFTES